jgi:hypothetical protein
MISEAVIGISQYSKYKFFLSTKQAGFWGFSSPPPPNSSKYYLHLTPGVDSASLRFSPQYSPIESPSIEQSLQSESPQENKIMDKKAAARIDFKVFIVT